jgi:hypothetical protein
MVMTHSVAIEAVHKALAFQSGKDLSLLPKETRLAELGVLTQQDIFDLIEEIERAIPAHLPSALPLVIPTQEVNQLTSVETLVIWVARHITASGF